MEEAKKKKEKKMKKLMFLAVVAAATVASAAVCVQGKDECGEVVLGAGTAHKVAISLKTTQLKSKVLRNKAECTESCTYWREPKTVKIDGLLWECLDDCSGCIPFGQNFAFWTKYGPIPCDEFAIGVGLIGKPDKNGRSKKAEGYGAMNGDLFGELAWAGFGSMAESTKTVDCVEDCSSYLKSLSGNIAGKLVAPEYQEVCDEGCDPVEYLGCCDDMQLVYTAAYGTIKIAFDKTTAKKVAYAGPDAPITAFCKVPAAVAPFIEEYVGEVTIED